MQTKDSDLAALAIPFLIKYIEEDTYKNGICRNMVHLCLWHLKVVHIQEIID